MNENVAVQPDASKIVELGMAFCGSKVMLSAVELGLFTVLHEGAQTEEQLRRRLELHGRGVRDFLNALVRMGLLAHTGESFANTELSDRYLVRGASTYMGSFLDRANRVLYGAWGNFTDALRTGEAQLDQVRARGNMFSNLYENPDAMRDFLAMMDGLNSILGPLLARAFDWSGHRSVVDIGGARGNLVASLIKAHPHLEATVFDLPPVEAAFTEHMAAIGLADRTTFRGGDFFSDPLPEGDVLIIGHVLEDWNNEQRQLLLKNAYAAVRPGGALLVYDPMLDDELSGLTNLLTSLTMLVATRGGGEYTSVDCQRWLREAGFQDTSAAALGSSDILVVGRKQR
ncbi:methyltransferase [Asanoa iriomotensis]|uniref:O-methyltransferase n=1 Tax=Asanoa iriomotensis TaxID=234613 RepID=A0ABQ4C0W0_9ACTN|nr:methyltransferase [Asanoa iriomotensis]GIF56420.1 O-methyltransferase [Asanoa iriomotensis]